MSPTEVILSLVTGGSVLTITAVAVQLGKYMHKIDTVQESVNNLDAKVDGMESELKQQINTVSDRVFDIWRTRGTRT